MSACKPYEIYAIKYAENPFATTSEVFLGGDAHDAPMPLDYFIWVIVGNGRRLVVDVGFRQEVAGRRKRKFLTCPTVGLDRLGIGAREVGEIIITHLHYDHAGNLDLFPNANVHIQELEMRFATGKAMCHPGANHIFEEDDVVQMVRKVFRGQTVFHDGEASPAPGISLHLIGGHTPGLQAVRVWTQRGWVVLASDSAHFYRNLQDRRPFMWSVHVDDVYAGFDRLMKLADSHDHVIPGHDPLVMQQYPAPSAELTGVVAQLHVPPRFSAFGARR
ncbi:MAG: N-acyl homoserine lactonase family protein [Burkholderiales bacterium]|nr:N-acyl homoserine lactonase family protein [Burkholderiales bacterium]